VIYTVVAENGTTQEYEVTVTEAPSSAKEMKTFALGTVSAPGVFVGTINEAAKTIEVLVPFGTNVTALVATFTIIGENVKIGLIVQESGTTVNDFTLPVVYTVTGADASTQDYTITVEDEPENKPATAVRVEMKPNNAGTSIPSGVFCSATPSITGSVFVTDSDGGSLVVTQWYDNNNLIPELTQTVTLPAGVTTYSQTIYDADGNRFRTGHVITFRATADGVPSNTATSGRIA
jgi:hypothetical protein